MKIHIVKNKYLNALFVLMLLSAIVHMLILFVIAAITQDMWLLNYFNIIQLSYFFPRLATATITSFIVTAILYVVILLYNGNNE